MNNLSNRVALITGGGSGIGRAIAASLAAEGCRVVIIGRTSSVLRETAAAVGEAVRWKSCDVADRSAVDALFAWLSETGLQPDILVNSAGVNVTNRLLSNIDPDEFDHVLQVNLTGTFNCTRAALPAMIEQKSGLIINVVSVAGRRAMLLGGLPYCVSKSAQAALGNFLNLEVAQQGVKVTNVYPGETNTSIVDRRPAPPTPEQRASMLQPEDVAACVIALAKLPPRAVVPELVVTPPHMMIG